MDKQNNQLEAFPNYDEYNQNNRLVNDVNYSYFFHKNKNLKNNIFNSLLNNLEKIN